MSSLQFSLCLIIESRLGFEIVPYYLSTIFVYGYFIIIFSADPKIAFEVFLFDLILTVSLSCPICDFDIKSRKLR